MPDGPFRFRRPFRRGAGPAALAARGQQALARAMNIGDLSALTTARTFELGGLGVGGAGRILTDAIDLLEQAVAATAVDDPDRASRLYSLGIAHSLRYETTKRPGDIDRAIHVGEQLAASIPPNHPARVASLNNLESALISRFELTASPGDLDRAIDVARELVSISGHHHPDRSRFLACLGYALSSRFDLSGWAEDQDGAIKAEEEALSVTSPDDPDRFLRLSNLCNNLRRRFEQTDWPPDLDRAIAVGEEAVRNTPQDEPNRWRTLENLAIALCERWKRTGWLSDVDWAIELAEERAAASSPRDRARALSQLRYFLVSRAALAGLPEDIDRAIEVGTEAVAITAPADAHRVIRLCNLCDVLLMRFEEKRSPGDADRAVDFGEEALSITPPGDLKRARVLASLGHALSVRFEASGRVSDIDQALPLLREVAEDPTAPVGQRVRAARFWGRLAGKAQRWPAAVEGLSAAVELTGLLAPPGLGQGAQEYRLRATAGLGEDAAASCLQVGTAERAVELLEQARGVMFSRLLDSRSDLTDLDEAYPRLGTEFRRAREELTRPVALEGFGAVVTARRLLAVERQGAAPPAVVAHLGHPASTTETEAARAEADARRTAGVTFERLLAEVRQQPGFESFLLPRPITDLLPAAGSGPVVLVNVADLRSDALILRADGVEDVPLPGLSPAVVDEQVSALLTALEQAAERNPGNRVAGEARITGLLGWLWDTITGPVLDRLHITGPPGPGQPWPRIYWCPTGPLAFLPLHAAGHHHTRHAATPLTVLDRVVSCTTPTVGALLQAGQVPAAGVTSSLDADAKVLVVAMPHTPGQHDLPGAATEAQRLAEFLPGRVDILGLADSPPATRAAVLAALPGHAWAHFSCHAVADQVDPSTSHLLLTDHQQHPLTVLDLTRTRLDGAQLAFLSACTTARTGALLPDEPIHLAAACQLAGYTHVIATLWPIDSNDAVRITEEVYRVLAPTAPGAEGAADALHTATHGIRALYPDQPSHWASHTHIGP
jgi:tetratricopeptide (TPR) repeat protein